MRWCFVDQFCSCRTNDVTTRIFRNSYQRWSNKALSRVRSDCTTIRCEVDFTDGNIVFLTSLLFSQTNFVRTCSVDILSQLSFWQQHGYLKGVFSRNFIPYGRLVWPTSWYHWSPGAGIPEQKFPWPVDLDTSTIHQLPISSIPSRSGHTTDWKNSFICNDIVFPSTLILRSWPSSSISWV